MVAGESNVGLLLSLWSNESVDLLDIDFVKFLACSLDHWLACSFVNDEYKCVVVLNGLDGRLTTQWAKTFISFSADRRINSQYMKSLPFN